MSTVPKEFRAPLTVAEASTCYNLPERFLRRLISEKKIPFIRVNGTRIRFLPDDVENWFESQRVEAITSPVPTVRTTRPLQIRPSTNGPKAKTEARNLGAK